MLCNLHPFIQCPAPAFGKPVARLGLASRGDHDLSREDVFHAIDRGITFINVPGLSEGDPGEDAMVDAMRHLGRMRDRLVLCAQFAARDAKDAREELRALLKLLGIDYIDLLTMYYVETVDEWDVVRSTCGVLPMLRAAKADGVVRRVGVTSHQRALAAEMARTGEVDAVMIRYNAAHRGAEQDVFPVTVPLGIPIVAYTATRWRRLLEATPDDPPGFDAPPAPAWYRFVLDHPAVNVVVCAPTTPAELNEDLEVLSSTGPLSHNEWSLLEAHGERVRKHARSFP